MEGICRACLGKSGKTYSVLGKVSRAEISIQDMLEYCTSKKLQLEGWPRVVCIPCFEMILLSYKFLKKFRESQAELETLYQGRKSLGNTSINRFLDIITGRPTTEGENEIEIELENDGIDHESSKVIADKDIEYCNSKTIDETESFMLHKNNDKVRRITTEENYSIEISKKSMKFQLTDAEPIVITRKFDFDNVEPFLFYRCPFCNVRIKNHHQFQAHVLKHNVHTIECKWCSGKDLIPAELYSAHYTLNHKYKCQLCNENMSSCTRLRHHMKQHATNTKKYECPIPHCKSTFLLFYSLKQHVLEKHSGSDKYKCPHCSLSFGTYHKFKYHKRKHHDPPKYICSFCGKNFLLPGHLRIHKYRHMKLKQFTCEVCGYSTVSNTQLKQHQKIRHSSTVMEMI